MWKQHLGVHVELENQEWKVFLKTLEATDFQIARMAWVGDYPDPNTFLELLGKSNGNNHSNWSHPEYDALLAQANRTQDRASRLQLLHRAEALLIAQAPIMPMYVYTRSELVKPYLMGHFLNYQQRLLFKYWWIDERWYSGTPERLPNTPPPLLFPERASGAAGAPPRAAP
jgi:ABC-type oligopeptide transport system substrate-binding subunit